MGMAASQARLLSLTSRLHDIELKAQSIEAQKIALATDQDELYQEYNAALDATRYQVAFTSKDPTKDNFVAANFKNLCTYLGSDVRCRDYAIKDNRTGRLIVTKSEKENYDTYKNDKFAFAWAMLGFGDAMNREWMELGTSNALYGDEDRFRLEQEAGMGGGKDGGSSIMTATEWDIYNAATGEKKSTLDGLYKNIEEAIKDNKIEDRNKAVKAFREELYKGNGSIGGQIFDKLNNPQVTNKTWDDVRDEFNYYCRKWESITEAGGCQVIDPKCESGEEGEAWFKNMVEAGLITILENTTLAETTGKWSETSIATSTNGNYLVETKDDRNQKKIEAKYQHELSIINRKDSKFDTELSKLETERTSITTEMDAIKTVRDDNIDRTFGIFS